MLATQPKEREKTFVTLKRNAILPYTFLLAMGAAWITVDAVLPLYGLLFTSAQLVPLSRYFLLPSQVLFPGRELMPFLPLHFGDMLPPSFAESWLETALLLCTFLLLFFCYLVALKYLSQRVGIRYILLSSCLLGGICVLIPVVTSPDVFSYIMYARMLTLYHLNPLATTPLVVTQDAVYKFLYWKDQPSAYGPTWIILSGLLQWCINFVPTLKDIPVMVFSLRLLGLLAHLWSIALIWSISGQLQRLNGIDKPRIRMVATLAFAWNPLLLFEACVNAHNDTVMLLFILLGLWFLLRKSSLLSCACVALMLALATCLKANAAVFFPGLLIFFWLQPRRRQACFMLALVYLGTVIALYAPFWDNGAILNLLAVNPGAYRNINTLPDFLGQVYNAIWYLLGHPFAADIGSPAEHVTHTLSLGLFALAYVFLCWQALFTRHRLHTPLQLVRWMAIAWFLYCLLGAPWFWPWYAVTCFGLFALVEASSIQKSISWNRVNASLILGIFAFSLLSSYCFVAWGVFNSFVPFLPGFRWAYVRGLWIWLPVLLLLLLWFRKRDSKSVQIADKNATT